MEAVTLRFWLLQAPRNQRLAVVHGGNKYEPIVCSINKEHDRGGRRLNNLSITVEPRGVKDFTWAWANDLFLSRKAVDVFERQRVTGFELKPVTVAYPKGAKGSPPELFELIVVGWGGLPRKEAGLSLVSACPGCGHTIYAISDPNRLIDPEAWDGSDFFIIWPLPKFIFVSNRLAEIIRQEKLSGATLVPAETIPMRNGATLSPGQLSLWMGEERARELTQRFGIP
jgi:hypothetical protein